MSTEHTAHMHCWGLKHGVISSKWWTCHTVDIDRNDRADVFMCSVSKSWTWDSDVVIINCTTLCHLMDLWKHYDSLYFHSVRDWVEFLSFFLVFCCAAFQCSFHVVSTEESWGGRGAAASQSGRLKMLSSYLTDTGCYPECSLERLSPVYENRRRRALHGGLMCKKMWWSAL